MKTAFERLDAFKDQIPTEKLASLIQALCNLSDDFPERQPSLLGFDVGVYAWRLVYFNLRREPDTKVRLQILKAGLSRSTGLALAVEIVSLDERVPEREQQGHDFLFEENQLAELKAISVEKLRRASKTSKFRRSPRLQSFLWRWSDWTTHDEVRNWLARYAQTTKGAVWLLTVLLLESHSFGQTHRVRYYINLKVLERFADVARLTQLIKRVKERRLPKKEAIAVREFRNALQRHAEGKPDNVDGKGLGEYGEEVVD